MVMLAPRWFYRARQFHKALGEGHGPAWHQIAQTYLNTRGSALFRLMSARDQAHSAKTAALVAGHADASPDLMAAALLHDIGKGRQTIRERILYVILAGSAPG